MYLFGICGTQAYTFAVNGSSVSVNHFIIFLHTIKLPFLWPHLMYDMAEELYELIKE